VGDELIEEIHEFAANLVVLLAALHVAGVLFETSRSGPGLLRAMTFGRDRPRT
jgi:cytochrome b